MEFYNEDSLIDWYFLIRATQIFQDKHGHYPGHQVPHENVELSILIYSIWMIYLFLQIF